MNAPLRPCDSETVNGNGVSVALSENLAKEFAGALRRLFLARGISRKLDCGILGYACGRRREFRMERVV